MSVRLVEGVIHLQGDCPVEDAETLLSSLQENASALIDIGDCGRIHMAVLQVMLAARRPVLGIPVNPFLREWLLPHLLSPAD